MIKTDEVSEQVCILIVERSRAGKRPFFQTGRRVRVCSRMAQVYSSKYSSGKTTSEKPALI